MGIITNILDQLTGEKSIGLGLGGGAVYGAAHIGVLRAMEEKEIEINMVAGTSIGAFVAAFYAFGMRWKEISDGVNDLDWMDISKISLSNYGLLSNSNFGKLVIKHLGDVQIEDAQIPLAMVATDITSGECIVLKQGSVAKAVIASTCIPGIFAPVEIDGRLLVDGGVVENVPISPLRNMGADQIIAVDLNTGFSNKRPANIIEVLLNSFHFTLANVTKQKTKLADILLTPDLSKFNRYDTKQIPELIEKGYQSALEILDREGQ